MLQFNCKLKKMLLSFVPQGKNVAKIKVVNDIFSAFAFLFSPKK